MKPETRDLFKPGKEYYVDFNEVVLTPIEIVAKEIVAPDMTQIFTKEEIEAEEKTRKDSWLAVAEKMNGEKND